MDDQLEDIPSPRLPQELIDHIIDHLYDDPLALANCARVCHAWLPTSRLHLFAKVSLKAASPHNGPAVPQDRCKRLHALLLRSPEIIPYIRELEICEGSPLHHTHPNVQSSTTWVTTERTLTALFKTLSHVERFDFSSTSIFHWSTLSPTFITALCVLFSLPSLTYVRLHSWVFPDFASLTRLLSHCQNLRALALSSTTINSDSGSELSHAPGVVPEDKDPGDLQHAQRPLEVLTLDYVNFAYLEYWLLGRQQLVDIRTLRELRVAHFQEPHIINRLLRALGGSLEHFHFKPGCWSVYPFDLSVNTGLRSLRLTLEDDPTTAAMDWAMKMLSSITESNAVLESVGIEFYAEPKKMTGWRELDALFMQPQFESLKRVEMGLFAIPTHADFIAVKEEMSGLGSRDIVRWYQLGKNRQRSSRQLTPMISRYES
ncbi:hypothetical protein JR316_0001716 [Psilocybe cubensis]|uniref:F-box domain-containing protein n=2 Tax=Psilocybe cubensis TaxID=181762 RepID=A0A8H7Y6K8_PSICU|nr:hypothetical protein JR316_0001716 [Psilocybe cubensis]KAH9484814.1 hypothetical protein JR316_0001716 [Psilocybe cubensis]